MVQRGCGRGAVYYPVVLRSGYRKFLRRRPHRRHFARPVSEPDYQLDDIGADQHPDEENGRQQDCHFQRHRSDCRRCCRHSASCQRLRGVGHSLADTDARACQGIVAVGARALDAADKLLPGGSLLLSACRHAHVGHLIPQRAVSEHIFDACRQPCWHDKPRLLHPERQMEQDEHSLYIADSHGVVYARALRGAGSAGPLRQHLLALQPLHFLYPFPDDCRAYRARRTLVPHAVRHKVGPLDYPIPVADTPRCVHSAMRRLQ